MAAFPESTIERDFVTKSLGELFDKNASQEFKYFNYLDSRDTCHLKYRIPAHQRYPQWTKPKKIDLINTIFNGFTMGGFILSQHFDEKQHSLYYNFEDGQTRMSVMQEYYDDGFSYPLEEGKKFSELSPYLQRRFENYKINLEVIKGANDDDIHMMFQRLQEGLPLKDFDKFWNWRKKPLIAFTIEVIKSDFCRSEYMKTDSFGDRDRKKLSHICGLVSSLAHGKDYITSSFRIHWPKINEGLSDEQKDRVFEYLTFYNTLIDRCYEELPLLKKTDEQNPKDTNENYKQWWNLSKEGGMIVYDWMDTNGESEEQKMDRWVYIINVSRLKPNFIDGKRLLYTGLSEGSKRNTSSTSSSAIGDRVQRIREFFAAEDKDEYIKCKNEM